MTTSPILTQYWRSATTPQLMKALRLARASVSAFAEVTACSGSLIQSWLDGEIPIEYDHYPANDVIDNRAGSQFFYHAHRDSAVEHGHLHLFWHATASGRRRYLRSQATRWVHTAPSHLVAIGLDARGLPVMLFTVNRWVTERHWFDARSTLGMIDRFRMGAIPGHADSCRWLTAFVRWYRPVIEDLLVRRDQTLAAASDPAAALADKGLEVLSATPIDWAADLEALEAEVQLRRSMRRQQCRVP